MMPNILKKYQNSLLLIIVLMATIIIYYKSVHFEFINWDDDRQVYENNDIKSLSANNIKKIFSTVYLKMYQPLTTLSYAVEYKIKGADPHIYHLHNLILHLLNSLLAFIFVFLLIRHSLASALIAFLFALHPMHVESVVWITERKDVLYTFFFLLSLIAYIKYLRKNRSLYWLIVCFVFFVFSLLSKSAAVTLPLILFLIDFKEGRPLKLNGLPDKIPFLLFSLLFGIISIFSQKVFDSSIEITQQFHFFDRFVLGAYAFFFYIIKMIAPTALAAIHPFPIKSSHLLPVPYFIALIGFILFLGSMIWLLIKRKFNDERSVTILFGILFFCFNISLVIFMPVGSALVAERYTYIPYIGLFISLISFLEIPNSKNQISNSKSQIPSPLSSIRDEAIRNPQSEIRDKVIRDEAIRNPQSAIRNQQSEIRDKVIRDEAIRNPQSALSRRDVIIRDKEIRDEPIRNPQSEIRNAIIRNYVIVPALVLWLIFLTYTTYNRIDVWKNSLVFWNDVIKKHPNNVPLAYNNRGVTKYMLHDYSGAIPDFTNAIHQHPKFKDAYQYRALSRFFINDLANSIRDFDTALMIEPAYVDAYINRGQAKANLGDIMGAIQDFSAATSVNPNDYLPYFNRGILLSLQGKKVDAYNDFCSAIRLEPSFADAYYARGMVAIDLSNKQQACNDFNQAAQRGSESGRKALMERCN